MSIKDAKKKMSRRCFIGGSVATVIGAGIGLCGAARSTGRTIRSDDEDEASRAPSEVPMIREYRLLGRTGYKVSDIAFGNAGMKDPSLLEYAIDLGINYVDTARQYYDMEKVIGKIFPAKRDKLFVTTKLLPELFTKDLTVEGLIAAIDESLKRLNTDYIDSCLIHSVGEDPNKPDRTQIKNSNIYRAFGKAKRDGKIRFWGASSHGPKMIEELTWLIDNTDIDMIMPGMNLLTKGLEPVLARAKEKNIAVVAMKTLSTARKIDYSAYKISGRTTRQALIKWMLAQPNIDALTITMRTFDEVDEYAAASGRSEFSRKERESLDEYCNLIDREYCRPGCSGCLDSCPHKVPIYDILRYKLYFNSYGREKYAMGLYSKLPESRRAIRCSLCSAPCEGTCQYNIPIRTQLLKAHTELTV